MESIRLVDSKYTEPINQRFITEVVQRFIDSNKKEIVFACIGTDKCIGDAVGPLVGTRLKSKDITVYGTLHEPIHALNMDDRLDEMNSSHPDAFIIGIDACLGDDDDIGNIILRSAGISPGKGVGKDLPSVGSMAIVSIVDTSDNSELFFSRSIRLSFITDIADKIVEIVEEIYAAITEYICFQEAAMTNLEDKQMRAEYGGVNDGQKETF